jgi:hypothetical protein
LHQHRNGCKHKGDGMRIAKFVTQQAHDGRDRLPKHQKDAGGDEQSRFHRRALA